MRADQRWSVVPLVLAAIPPLLIAGIIVRYAENVPFRDQWWFAPDVADYWSGRYAWGRLWRPSGDHRVVVPRMLMLGLAGWTHWDVRAEIWFGFVLACGGLLLVADLARRTLGPVTRWWAWTVPVSSAALFSMAAWQSWTLGWMMTAHLCVFGAILVAWGLGRYATSGHGLSCMLIGSAVAAYSYLSGLALLMLLPVATAALPRHRRRLHVTITAAWAVVLIALYFSGYPQRSVTRPIDAGVLDAKAIGLFVVHYLGSPLANGRPGVAFAWGTGALLAIVSTALLLRSSATRPAAVPWLLLAAFVVASAVVTAVGRLSAGPEAALFSRYALVSGLLWACMLPCLVLLVHGRPWPAWMPSPTGAVLLLVLLLAAQGYAAAWRRGVAATETRRDSLRIAGRCLHDLAHADDHCLQRICPREPMLVRRVGARLARLGLGPYAVPAAPATQSSREPLPRRPVAGAICFDPRIESALRRATG